ncbi:MAG: FecR domain-containing protein [Proteiniphilum sp.]|nr:FecR domain-containing protein [Proteiniphilum sp.]MDD4799606.1 FecR domain-containing protein [Proteiniphilum sp.]
MKEEDEKLIYDFLSGNITKNDLYKLNEWVHASPENQNYFEKLKHIWLLSSGYEDTPIHFERSYTRFLERIRKEKRHTSTNRWVKYAGYAAAIILLLVTTTLIFNNFNTPDDLLISEVYAPRRSKLRMKLPDGSVVWLNADSKISYSEKFGRKNRHIQLTGEGYFEVKQGEYPFIVQTDSSQIKVLGTKFNIKNYSNEDYIKISLLEGSIALSGGNKEYIMKPGNTMTLNKANQVYTLTENIDYAEQWINNKVFWDETPLITISKELERQFDVQFTFDSESLRHLIFHGSFIIETNNLEEILDIMAETNKFKYSIDKNNVYIFHGQ